MIQSKMRIKLRCKVTLGRKGVNDRAIKGDAETARQGPELGAEYD